MYAQENDFQSDSNANAAIFQAFLKSSLPFYSKTKAGRIGSCQSMAAFIVNCTTSCVGNPPGPMFDQVVYPLYHSHDKLLRMTESLAGIENEADL